MLKANSKEVARKAPATRRENALKAQQFEQKQSRLALAAFEALGETSRLTLADIRLMEERLLEEVTAEIEQCRLNLKTMLRDAMPKLGYAALRGCIEQMGQRAFRFEPAGFDPQEALDEIAMDLWLDTYITPPGEFDPDAILAAEHSLVLGSPEWVKFMDHSYGAPEGSLTGADQNCSVIPDEHPPVQPPSMA